MRVTAGHSLTWEQPNNSTGLSLSRALFPTAAPYSPIRNQSITQYRSFEHQPFRACVSIFWSKVASAQKYPGLWENLLSSIIILVVGACVSSWGINYIIDLVGKGHTEENRHSPSPFNFIFSHISILKNQLWLIAILLVVTFSLAALTLAYSRNTIQF